MQTDRNFLMCKYARMDKVQLLARAWLLEAMEKTNLKASQLAREAGVAPSTLTRFLNATSDPDAIGIKYALSTRTLQAIADVAKMTLPEKLRDISEAAPGGNLRHIEGYRTALELLETLSPEDCTRWLEFGRNLASIPRRT